MPISTSCAKIRDGMNRPEPEVKTPSGVSGTTNTASAHPSATPTPSIPDHELLRRIGEGSYGEVWLARNKLGPLRAVKVVYRRAFEDARPFEREFRGIQKFEPISRSHDGFVDILVGGTEEYFYYVMELVDAARNSNDGIRNSKEDRMTNRRFASPRWVYSWFLFADQIPASAPDKWPSQEIGPACGITP